MEDVLQLVRRTAALAMIELGKDEEADFARDLRLIMDYMERLVQIDTGDLEPMEHVLPVKNALREDLPEGSQNSSELLGCAQEVKDGYYVVPSVVDPL